jgi:hypothetical protein
MSFLERAPRRPIWSGALTGPLARHIPERWRPAVLVFIKAFHSAAFFSISGLILLFTWDGFRGRLRRRTAIAGAVALTESAVYASNNQVCPLTPLAEALGSPSGSVTDIYLPEWLSRRVPRRWHAAGGRRVQSRGLATPPRGRRQVSPTFSSCWGCSDPFTLLGSAT